MIVVGSDREGVSRRFRDVEQAAVVSCGYCMPYENNRQIFLGRDPYEPLREFWAQLKHYD